MGQGKELKKVSFFSTKGWEWQYSWQYE